MNRSLHANSLRVGRTAFNLSLLAAASQLPTGAWAQEAIRNSLEAQAATERKPVDLADLPYTVKAGDFRLLVTPSATVEYNDNVTVSKSNTLSDEILRPKVQIDASYPLTQFNLLDLNVGGGYNDYIQHDRFNSFQLDTGSQLSFDTYVKDVQINLHDRFDYSDDPASEVAVTGTGNYVVAHNVVGVLSTWNPKDLNLSLGYDHQNTMPVSSQFQSQASASELFDGKAGWRFIPTATVGLEGTYSITTYDQAILNNNNAYTVGAYGDWQAGAYFHLAARAGITIDQFQNTSQGGQIFTFNPTGIPTVTPTNTPLQTSDLLSYYGDLTVTHDVSDEISYSFSVGHEIQPGIQSDAIEDSYLRLSALFKVIRFVDVKPTFSYEHGQQGVGNVSGNLTEVYDYYVGGLEFTHQFTKRIKLDLNYRLTYRSSSESSMEYLQNDIGLQFSYAFL